MDKNMGSKGTYLLLEIFNKTWMESRVPNDWKLGFIVPIFKKEDSKDCNNYRRITLLSTIKKTV